MYDNVKKIVSATVEQGSDDLTGPQPKVTATFEDGEVKNLFYYEPTQISFTESGFIGLTEKEAHDLYTEKDITYLRSPED